MAWSAVGSIQVSRNWQYTEPVAQGTYFRLKHTDAPLGALFGVALCEVGENGQLSIGNSQILEVERNVNDIIELPIGAYTDRRIAIKRFKVQPKLEEEIRRLFVPAFLIPQPEIVNYIQRNNWTISIEVSDYVAPTDSSNEPTNNTKALTFSSHGDSNGACYWVGTNYGSEAWVNPHFAGRLTCLLSSTFDSNDLPQNLVDRQINQRPATQNLANSWMGIDFGANKKLKCNYYSLRGRDFSSDHLRTWELQGSNDYTTWVTLDTQSNNTAINQNTWFSAAVNTDVSYRYLRVMQTGLSNANSNVMTLGEFEFYGDFITI